MKKILVLVMVLLLVGCTKEYTIEQVENLEVENLTNRGQIIQDDEVTIDDFLDITDAIIIRFDMFQDRLDTIDMNIDRIEDERMYMIDEVCSVRMFDDFLEDVFSISADPTLSIRIYYDTNTKTIMLYDLFGENIVEQVTIYEMFEDACN
jgi:hypothetical protein